MTIAEQICFVDTNVFARWLTQDEPTHAVRATELLNLVEAGEIAATTSEGVIVELVYILQSKRTYARTREQIQELVRDVINLRGLRLARKTVYLRALDLFAQNGGIDFVDCLNVAHMEYAGIREIWTFDKDYARMKGISGVVSREP